MSRKLTILARFYRGAARLRGADPRHFADGLAGGELFADGGVRAGDGDGDRCVAAGTRVVPAVLVADAAADWRPGAWRIWVGCTTKIGCMSRCRRLSIDARCCSIRRACSSRLRFSWTKIGIHRGLTWRALLDSMQIAILFFSAFFGMYYVQLLRGR